MDHGQTSPPLIAAVRRCPVCSSPEAFLLHQIDYPADAGRLLPSRYRIVGCRKCGMVYDDFDAGEAAFAAHYRSSGKYGMAETGGAGGRNPADLKNWRNIFGKLTPLLKDKTVSILDTGCGKGGLLQTFYEAGYRNVMGIDASPGCIGFIRSHYDFPAVCGDVCRFQMEKKFDLILSTYVMEHLFRCREYLNALRGLLSPGGLLYVEVPDASNYLKSAKAPFYFFDQEHINHFQPDSLKNLLNQCGYELLRSEQFSAEPIPGFLTPALRVLAAPGTGRATLKPNDFSAVAEYVADGKKRDLAVLSALPGTGYLWGAGAYCERLLAAGVFDSLKLAGVIDKDPEKQGTMLCGLRIFPPEILREAPAPDYVIITSVLYAGPIRGELHAAGFQGKIIVAG